MAADLAPPPPIEVAWPSAERRRRAMGTDVHVLVVGPRPGPRLARAMARLDQLEARWSRFRPSSEISELNRRAGQPVPVSADTRLLLERAVVANRLTGGRFDPTLGDELQALGYDRSFERLDAESAQTRPDPDRRPSDGGRSVRVPRPAGPAVTVDHRSGTATVHHRGFDPGGVGKGLAADLIVEELLADGAWGALVNLGGDLRVGGTPPSGPNWVVAIDHPRRGPSITVVELVEGGLATSTTLRRRWAGSLGTHHHLLDPATGRPHHTGADFATAIGPEAWLAEAAATALIGTTAGDVAGRRTAEATLPPGCAALLLDGDGAPDRLGRFAAYERPGP